jgi:hypothetical protein
MSRVGSRINVPARPALRTRFIDDGERRSAPMRFAHPILAGLFIVATATFLLRQSLRTGRMHFRGPGPPVYRRKQPVSFWTSIAGMAAVLAVGAALIVWGAIFAPQ